MAIVAESTTIVDHFALAVPSTAVCSNMIGLVRNAPRAASMLPAQDFVLRL